MKIPEFKYKVLDENPPGSFLDICLIGDINNDGLPDIVIGGKEGKINLFWYRNPDWKIFKIASIPNLEAGGVLFDINNDGYLDIIAGQQEGGNLLLWFENPGEEKENWKFHIIEDRFEKYHDQAVGDIDGDGEVEILISSQNAGVIAYFDIPDNPRVSPWPEECCHVIAENLPDIEGLCIADINNDGKNELIIGPNIFFPPDNPGKAWKRKILSSELVKTRVAVGDIDGYGRLEIVFSEGESFPGRLVWVSISDWKFHLLRDDLFHPHSLAVADFNGDGLLDIFVAEMGLGKNSDPKMFVYLNKGNGKFEEVIIQCGIPTHEAKVGDLTGNGLPDIAGKPYHPEKHIDIWINESR